MPPDMGTQPGQTRERVDKEREKDKDRSSKQAEQASGSSSSSLRVGNYRLDGEIGRGSFATVYLGYKSVCLPSSSHDNQLTMLPIVTAHTNLSPSCSFITSFRNHLRIDRNPALQLRSRQYLARSSQQSSSRIWRARSISSNQSITATS